jgi:hypothetical protein
MGSCAKQPPNLLSLEIAHAHSWHVQAVSLNLGSGAIAY